jgi:hypothetical protein
MTVPPLEARRSRRLLRLRDTARAMPRSVTVYLVRLLLLVAIGMAVWIVASWFTSVDGPPEMVLWLSFITTAVAVYWFERLRE